MWDLHTTTDMRLLLLVCLLTWPGITSADETSFVTVAEGDDAVLNCSFSSKENIEQMKFDWKKDGDDRKQVFLYDKGSHYNNGRSGQDQQFEGRVSHFQDELKFGNASIKIRNTELADNGSYICIFPDKQTSHFTLYVVPELKVRPYIPGAASKPSVTILGASEDGILLQCEVQRASPKPDVVWQDHAGDIIISQKPQITERGDSYDIILLATVTKTDYYNCTATQEEIKHQVSAKIYVPLPGTSTPWVICGILCAALLLVVVAGAVLYQRLKKKYEKGPTSKSQSEPLNGNSSSG